MNDKPKFTIVGLFNSSKTCKARACEEIQDARDYYESLKSDPDCNEIRIFVLGVQQKDSNLTLILS